MSKSINLLGTRAALREELDRLTPDGYYTSVEYEGRSNCFRLRAASPVGNGRVRASEYRISVDQIDAFESLEPVLRPFVQFVQRGAI